MQLEQWLAHIERLHALPIDMGLDRVKAVWRSLQEQTGVSQNALVITVGGTNGKGSTCAMLESILLAAGYRVGTHTSPHLLHFSERARVNGAIAPDALLEAGFAAVEAARGSITLSYFEFSLLAILHAFHASNLDVWVLEIGLGGRLDAVNMLEPDCSIVTCVDIDHAAYLGDTREKIGLEKAHIFRPNRPAICADPVPPESLKAHAAAIGADLWLFARDYNYQGDRLQWSYAGRANRRNSMAYPALRGANQLLNASGVLAALEALRDRIPVTQQAVRQGFATVELPGRFQVLPGRPNVVLDVAHNPHAAAHLAQNLDNMGFFPTTFAVFGMLADKDIAAVVAHLKNRIDRWLVCTTQGARGTSAQQLRDQLALQFGIQADCFDSAKAALAAARQMASENDRIVVFGSFLVVADVLS
jgi:dihydrofolate synthase / folylpolyglutamate synthase